MKAKAITLAALLIAAVSWTAFGGVKFVKTWTNPEAQASNWQGKKVAVFARTLLNPNREQAEKAMVRELAQRGAQGVPGYKLVPPELEKDRDGVKRILTDAGIAGAVVLRIAGFDQQTVVTGAAAYNVVSGSTTFSGYWDSGTVVGFTPGRVDEKATVMVECLIYALDQDKLVWSGISKVVNPGEVDKVIKSLANSIGSEVRKAGLVKR